MNEKVARWLTLFTRRPILIPPLLILLNLVFILLYGMPQFEQSKVDDETSFTAATPNEVAGPLATARRHNEERLRHVSKICAKYNQDANFRKLLMSGTALVTPNNNLFYCFIPKVGCTFWKRVIRFVSKDYKGHYTRPENIPRLYTHLGPYINTKVVQLKNLSNPNALDHKLKFMFTRDPYERLWSGYLDKLFLPDFWWWLGTKIVNATRPKADRQSVQCGHDVTFEEFLKYTTNRLKAGKHIDNHFSPIYIQCNPCSIQFDVIGKLESFKEDSELVLTESNILLWNISKSKTNDMINEEVHTLIKYNFDLLNHLKQKSVNLDCLNPLLTAQRLWKTFQYNGYIDDEEEFPFMLSDAGDYDDDNVVSDPTVLRKALLKKIIHLRNSAGIKAEIWKQQRQKYLNLAYRSVSQKVLKAIGLVYRGDMELFGYDVRNFSLTKL